MAIYVNSNRMREDGTQLKSTRHCKYQSGHHFVWIPFKRRKIFTNEAIIEVTKRYVTEAIENNDMELIAIEVDRTLMDHVHVFVSFPPRMSASQAVNIMKGYSSRRLRMEFPRLENLHEKSQLTVYRRMSRPTLPTAVGAGTVLYPRRERARFYPVTEPSGFYKK
ncbi:IS200/IS605 family transposase [Parathermosynechococcus lividus]